MKRWAVGILAVGCFLGAWAAIVRSQAPVQAGGSAAGGRPPVAKADYERWKTELSNWGRWGKDDEIGSEAAQDVAPQPPGSEIGALPLHDFALIMINPIAVF